jgi:hypothetical protein
MSDNRNNARNQPARRVGKPGTASSKSTPPTVARTPILARRCACDCHAPLKVTFSREGEKRGELVRLAELSGISESMISNTIAGRKTPSVKTLVHLAHALSKTLKRPVTLDAIVRMPAVWRKLFMASDAGE